MNIGAKRAIIMENFHFVDLIHESFILMSDGIMLNNSDHHSTLHGVNRCALRHRKIVTEALLIVMSADTRAKTHLKLKT